MTASSTSEEAGLLAETIISQFKKGDPAAIATYQKVCKTIDSVENWVPEGVIQFLEQFLNIGHMLDAKCKLFIEKLAGISWHVVPLQIRKRYVDTLRELSIHHVCHTETLLSCFAANLLPRVRPVVGNEVDVGSGSSLANFETILSDEEQSSIYDMAHDAIKFVLTCFPMTTRLLQKALRRNFPHFNAPLLRYKAYIKNLFHIYEYAVDIRGDLWKLLFENLIQLDSVVSKKIASKIPSQEDANANETYDIFLMDEESERWIDLLTAENEEREVKLDACLCYIFAFISKAHCREIPSDIVSSLNWVSRSTSQEGMYLYLRNAFETYVLLAPGLKCVPFIMFFLLSLEKKYLHNFTKWLWGFVLSPSQSPNDWKKGHAAACYLGSLLSRAKFVDFKFCFGWMERLVKWCTRYVNEVVGGSAGATAGTLRHGAFYAVCQALLVTFSFRYNEIVDENELENVRRWGLGHIVHSSLQPLRYINHAAASNFATISRSLQLVYCNHILPQSLDDVNVPFEPFFPFEFYFLHRSSVFLHDLTLRFSPSVEDAGEVRRRCSSGPSRSMSFQGSMEHGSLEFLDDLRRDKEMLNDEYRGIWPLIRSPQYSFSKLPSSSIRSGIITPSSLMDTN